MTPEEKAAHDAAKAEKIVCCRHSSALSPQALRCSRFNDQHPLGAEHPYRHKPRWKTRRHLPCGLICDLSELRTQAARAALKKAAQEKKASALDSPQNIVIDCDFEDKMVRAHMTRIARSLWHLAPWVIRRTINADWYICAFWCFHILSLRGSLRSTGPRGGTQHVKPARVLLRGEPPRHQPRAHTPPLRKTCNPASSTDRLPALTPRLCLHSATLQCRLTFAGIGPAVKTQMAKVSGVESWPARRKLDVPMHARRRPLLLLLR